MQCMQSWISKETRGIDWNKMRGRMYETSRIAQTDALERRRGNLEWSKRSKRAVNDLLAISLFPWVVVEFTFPSV